MKREDSFVWFVGLLASLSLGIAGCQRTPPPASMPPPVITVSRPIEREITNYEDFTGRTDAIDSVQVRARVSGYLEKINFKDGEEVKKGAVLFEIDPRPYKAALDKAEGQVRLYQAQLRYQEAEYKRNVRLLNTGGAASQEDVEKSLASRDTAQASLKSAQAEVEQQKLNLEWTKVIAPISGLLSRTLITRGNLVAADQTLLTTIVAEDPMYAYFDVDEPTVERIRELIRQGKVRSAREKGVRVPVFLRLEIEEGYPHEGYVDFVNNRVDPSTGTLQVRGLFPNPKPPVGPRVLAPGHFVRIRVSIGPPYKALLVNERALGANLGLQFVYIVNDRNEVVRRDVKVGVQQGDLHVIEEGLKPSERVIVNGLQHVRPGIVVNPKLEPMPEGSEVKGQGSGKKGTETKSQQPGQVELKAKAGKG